MHRHRRRMASRPQKGQRTGAEEEEDAKAKLNKESLSALKRVLGFARPELRLLVIASIALLFSSISYLGVPYFAGLIIEAVASSDPESAQKGLERAAIGMSILFGVGAIFSFLRAYLFTLAGERVVVRLRNRLFRAIVRQEVGFFDTTRTGELVNRLSADTTVIQNAATVNISMALRWFVQITGCIIILFALSWKLTLVMLGVVPAIAFGASAYGRYVRKLARKVQDALAGATEVAEEALSTIRTVKSYSGEILESVRYRDRVAETFIQARKMAVAYGAFLGGIGLLGNAAIVLVLYFGGKLVISGEIPSAGTLTSFILYTISMAASLAGLSSLYGDIMKAVGASTRVFELLDRPSQIHPLNGISPVDEMKGLIQFDGVCFSYPSRPEIQVLNKVSLSLRPGKVVALVGPSGGGKSTIAHLVEGFYRPLEGKVFLDGVDISTISPRWLHSNIGIVSQEPDLMSTSIADNIAYGHFVSHCVDSHLLFSTPKEEDVESQQSSTKGFLPDDVQLFARKSPIEEEDKIPRERIIEAAKKANAHDFISEFPDGYDTAVGERGIRLSGGQKQRVAIARSIIMDPKILLMDEATSALDAESEELVQEALDRLMKGRTVLVIAHRLCTVKRAAIVHVIDKGTIVESGSHEELLARGGVYKQLVKRQLQWEDDEDAGLSSSTDSKARSTPVQPLEVAVQPPKAEEASPEVVEMEEVEEEVETKEEEEGK